MFYKTFQPFAKTFVSLFYLALALSMNLSSIVHEKNVRSHVNYV